MKRVYLGNKELTTIATVTNGGGGGDDTQKWVDYFNGTLTEFTVPEGVTKIKDYAFAACSSLTGITIPNSVTSIEKYTFYNCTSLNNINIPDSVTIIKDSAFEGCSSLVTVTIQNSTSKFYYGYNAFANISSSAKLYVPSNLLSDYQADSSWTGAFKGGIYAIPIPAMKVTYTDGSEKTFYNLTSIDENTDPNKANAKNVVIYDSVHTIYESAFENCTSLTSVTIPSTTTWIGQSIFNGCTSLSNIIYQGTMAKWNNIKFHGSWHDGVPSTTVVTCSDGTVKL